MIGLGVNIDHVATIRQARRTVEPDPVWAAAEAELGGAAGITFHLRKDRRHINDRDASLLKETVRCKLNMEMSLDDEIVHIAAELACDQATLVPENRQEITTEGGLDVLARQKDVAEVTARLSGAGMWVSAFVDPVPDQIHAAREAGCDAIEIHTGQYANAWGLGGRAGREGSQESLEEIAAALELGQSLGLEVHAGHGLTYDNVLPLARMRGFGEFNIGHSIIARSVLVGLRQAVADMNDLLRAAACAGA